MITPNMTDREVAREVSDTTEWAFKKSQYMSIRRNALKYHRFPMSANYYQTSPTKNECLISVIMEKRSSVNAPHIIVAVKSNKNGGRYFHIELGSRSDTFKKEHNAYCTFTPHFQDRFVQRYYKERGLDVPDDRRIWPDFFYHFTNGLCQSTVELGKRAEYADYNVINISEQGYCFGIERREGLNCYITWCTFLRRDQLNLTQQKNTEMLNMIYH